MNYADLAQKVISGYNISEQEAEQIANAPDEDLDTLLEAAYSIREHHHGNKVKIHVLQNAKSGVCPEDCKFCSQSLKFRDSTNIPRYPMQEVDELVEKGIKAKERGAVTYCMVTSTRGPNSKDLDNICEATKILKEKYPTMGICASLGLLKEGQAKKLKEAGVDRYNHNLETSERYFHKIVGTHTWGSRFDTLQEARENGLELCTGSLLGMGEEKIDWVSVAMDLKKLNPESIPVNFLDPRPGTPLGDSQKISKEEALKALCLFRFIHPKADIRMAGGREVTLLDRQADGLKPANSLFVEGYLTTLGQGEAKDYKMIKDAGFEPIDC